MRIVLLDNITAPSMKSRMSAPMRHGIASLDKYLVGLDLVKQLAEYTERKQPQHPDLTNERLRDEIDASIRRKGWELGKIEFGGIMGGRRER